MPTQSGNVQSNGGYVGNSQSSNGSAGQANGGNIGIGIGSTSITQPARQRDFRVHVEATPKTFDNQVIALALNMVSKEIVVFVEQSLTNQDREHVIIQNLIDSPGRVVTLDTIDVNGIIIDTIKFRDCSVIGHTVEYNYANSGAVVHIVNLSYTKIDLTSNTKSHAAFNSAMSIVGRP